MLFLQTISFLHYKNYISGKFNFTERVTGIYGKNGTGKTNILDAIYTLGYTKSYFALTDADTISYQKQGLRIEGVFTKNNQQQNVELIIRENGKKEIFVNKEACKKFSGHIGSFPSVMIAPDDTVLITGAAEIRRKFIDTLIAQINATYLHALINYNKLLKQRNSLLKNAAENNAIDTALLEILNEQLSNTGQYIYTERKKIIAILINKTAAIYTAIAQKNDTITITYESQLNNNNLLSLLQTNTAKEIAVGRTCYGIHKDDVLITIHDVAFKNAASQGQRKSLLFALKLAEWQIIETYNKIPPIILLDDVFEKLDEERMHYLLQWVYNQTTAQIIITDTHEQRLAKSLEKLTNQYKLINLTDTFS